MGAEIGRSTSDLVGKIDDLKSKIETIHGRISEHHREMTALQGEVAHMEATRRSLLAKVERRSRPTDDVRITDHVLLRYVEPKVGPSRARHAQAHHPLSEGVDRESHIDETRPGHHKGEIAHPPGIRPRHLELPGTSVQRGKTPLQEQELRSYAKARWVSYAILWRTAVDLLASGRESGHAASARPHPFMERPFRPCLPSYEILKHSRNRSHSVMWLSPFRSQAPCLRSAKHSPLR